MKTQPPTGRPPWRLTDVVRMSWRLLDRLVDDVISRCAPTLISRQRARARPNVAAAVWRHRSRESESSHADADDVLSVDCERASERASCDGAEAPRYSGRLVDACRRQVPAPPCSLPTAPAQQTDITRNKMRRFLGPSPRQLCAAKRPNGMSFVWGKINEDGSKMDWGRRRQEIDCYIAERLQADGLYMGSCCYSFWWCYNIAGRRLTKYYCYEAFPVEGITDWTPLTVSSESLPNTTQEQKILKAWTWHADCRYHTQLIHPFWRQ